MSLKKDTLRSEHMYDKLGLFILAGFVVAVLGIIVVGAYMYGIRDKADVLLGGVATGLILFLRDIVAAFRTTWEERNRTSITEKLVESPTTKKVEIDQPAGEPVPVKPAE